MWNTVSGINELNDSGESVYTDFCLGRAEAFEYRPTQRDNMSAATGIGSLGGGVFFYLLARRSARPINLENPRQQPAYHYPRQYGPRPPSFARGSYLGRQGTPGQIYVSGTASVIGHATRHKGDVEQQCETALENIALLIGRENLAAHGIHADRTLADLRAIKVYVKHSEDVSLVRKKCDEVFSEHARVAYLNVDVCRDDLLVEIEGMIP
jgi:chorismate lyase / 3-hydroxybenzoate synthase